MKDKLFREYLERRTNKYADREFLYGIEEGFDYGFDACFDFVIEYLNDNCKKERNDWALGNSASFLERKREEILSELRVDKEKK
jgi:hypothetical protein